MIKFILPNYTRGLMLSLSGLFQSTSLTQTTTFTSKCQCLYSWIPRPRQSSWRHIDTKTVSKKFAYWLRKTSLCNEAATPARFHTSWSASVFCGDC